MRRLLLVTYHFPPEPAAGALRPGFLAKYLPEFGWEVTVLTRPLGDSGIPCRVVPARAMIDLGAGRNGHAARLPRLVSQAKDIVLFPDRTAPWFPAAVQRGLSVLCEQRFDAILTSAMPPTVHLVGAMLARARGLPWVADYRDPWSGNFYLQHGTIRTALDTWFERALMRGAASLTTISQPIAEHLERLHRRTAAVIPNGFEPLQSPDLRQLQPRGFTFCYTGTMYDGKRCPALLFEALAELRARGEAVAQAPVLFYGPPSDHVRDLAARYGVDDIVEQRGIVSHADALTEQRLSSNLLIFLNTDESTVHELGSKIIEYAGARRPIVAFGPRESAMREYIARHRLGWFATNLEEAKEALLAARHRFDAGDVELEPSCLPSFEARDLAAAFARELDGVVNVAPVFSAATAGQP